LCLSISIQDIKSLFLRCLPGLTRSHRLGEIFATGAESIVVWSHLWHLCIIHSTCDKSLSDTLFVVYSQKGSDVKDAPRTYRWNWRIQYKHPNNLQRNKQKKINPLLKRKSRIRRVWNKSCNRSRRAWMHSTLLLQVWFQGKGLSISEFW
jgi:hypothetical protein